MTTEPQDHKKPVSKTFSFEHNGETFTIPSISTIKPGVFRKLRKIKNDELDLIFTLLEQVIGDDTPEMAALDDMDADQFKAVINDGWLQGATAGESSDS